MSDKKKNAELSENEEKKAKKTDSKKSQKSNKDKKNIFKRFANWCKDLKREFKRVSWPTKKSVFDNTVVVLSVVVLGSVLIGLLDTGLLKLMNVLMNL